MRQHTRGHRPSQVRPNHRSALSRFSVSGCALRALLALVVLSLPLVRGIPVQESQGGEGSGARERELVVAVRSRASQADFDAGWARRGFANRSPDPLERERERDRAVRLDWKHLHLHNGSIKVGPGSMCTMRRWRQRRWFMSRMLSCNTSVSDPNEHSNYTAPRTGRTDIAHTHQRSTHAHKTTRSSRPNYERRHWRLTLPVSGIQTALLPLN